jgi:hypothetical protein
MLIDVYINIEQDIVQALEGAQGIEIDLVLVPETIGIEVIDLVQEIEIIDLVRGQEIDNVVIVEDKFYFLFLFLFFIFFFIFYFFYFYFFLFSIFSFSF